MLDIEWNLNDALAASFEDGYEEGRNDAIESVALNMLRSDMTIDKIKELTQLSSERIQELANALTK